MSLNSKQQFLEQVNHSKNILLTFKQDYNEDILASANALNLVLSKLNKNHEIACADFAMPKKMEFLPFHHPISPELNSLRKMIINLNLKQKDIDKVSYNIKNDNLQIFLSPKKGLFTEKDLKTEHTDYKYDLILTLNTPDLESLSHIYQQHPDFFFHTPVINIDHNPDNEQYGHLNIISLTSSSVSEIIYELISVLDKKLIDEKVATALLTGLISKTNSFKTPQVSPRTLDIASELIAIGGQRDLIVKNLYYNKSANTLKLWGKLLNKLQTTDDSRIAWTKADIEDFKETQSKPESLLAVIEELISAIPTVEFSVIFYQLSEGSLSCLIKSEKNIELKEKFSDYQAQGSKNLIKLLIKEDLEKAQHDIIEKLKKFLGN